MYRWLVPRVVVPLYERLSGRRPWTELRRLRALQWRSPEELEARALARLRPLLAHAHAHVPYYRALFDDAGVGPDDIRAVADLARLPITGKAELRAGFPDRVVADNLPARRRRRRQTSGSTWLPFEFYTDRASSDARDATSFLFQHWAGVARAGAVLRLGSPPRASDRGLHSRRFRDAVHRAVLGERVVRLAGMELTPSTFLAELGRLPRGCEYYIMGFPSHTARLAARLVRAGTELPGYPRVVIIGAETATAADVAVIGRAFRCPVVNRYGCWEFGLLAQTCPDNAGALHANGTHTILRVVREDGSAAAPGESGRVVVTHLGNWVMPFINYDIGDRARVGPRCPCGRGFPTLATLEGRAQEVIRTPGGRVVSPNDLDLHDFLGPKALRHALDGVWEYQAVQTAADAVVVRVVPTPRFSAEVARELAASLTRHLGPDMDVRVETVERIPVEPSGKRLLIKSQLPTP